MRRSYAQASGVMAVAVVGAVAAIVTVSASSGAGQHAAGRAPHTHSVTLDGSRMGRVFQGVGAVSGGGGNSRLLIDYPEPQRQQVLDYLFKPGYGADLQLLKIEIGGDAYATDGAEPSFEQTRGKINCDAGYEFWIAQQARKLNPGIQLYGLQWNAPRWVGGKAENPWTQTDIKYLLDWLHCATQLHLKINYLGGWNEHLPHGITPQIMQWFIDLRKTLDTNGYKQVKIVAVDSFAHLKGNDIANFLAKHAKFRRAISVLGYHNLCRYPATGKLCSVPKAARTSGKPIWESEIGALRETTGVPAMARSIPNGFIQVDATGFFEWPLIGSMPAYLPEEDRGLMFADRPWNGFYHVQLMSWVLGQTTNFTDVGWRHINGASGQLGGLYGSYTSYEPADHSAWTLVAQTTEAPRAQTIKIHVKAGLPRSVVHVWSTNLNSTSNRSWFVNRGVVHPSGGSFSYRMRPGFIYTFTTTSGQKKGTAAPPPAKAMPLPYTASPDLTGEPKWLGAQDGSFEYPSGNTTTFEQSTVGKPTFWQNPVNNRFPYAVVGDNGWKNYTVSTQVTFHGTGQSAGVISRFDHPKADGIAEYFEGYQLILSQNGSWKLLRNKGGGPRKLASGKLSKPIPLNTPITIALKANGSTLTGSVDGHGLRPVTDRTYSEGDAGISTSGWYRVGFTNLTVTK